jgi:hypothetical protein
MGCNDEESVPESPTLVLGSTTTPPPTATPRTPEVITGIAEVDTLIDALQVEPVRARREALEPLLRFSPVPCSYAPTEGDPKPLCRAGEEQDQSVDVVTFDNCGFQYLRRDEAGPLIILLANSTLYAVYEAPEVAYSGTAEYIAILYDQTGADQRAANLLIHEGAITSYTDSCNMSPEDYITALQLTDVVYQAEGGE